MNDKNREKTFIHKAKETLDKEAENLDEMVLLRLKHSRYMALEKGRGSIFNALKRFRLPMAGLATGLATVIALFFFTVFLKSDNRVGQQLSNIEDVEILAAGDTPELFINLDFYAWLAEENDDAG